MNSDILNVDYIKKIEEFISVSVLNFLGVIEGVINNTY